MTGDDFVIETELLQQFAENYWAMYWFGDRRLPTAFAAVRRWRTAADVIVLRGHDRAVAYRAVGGEDPIRAELIYWHYLGSVRDVLRSVLGLRIDADFGCPYPIPDECRVPELGGSYTLRPAPARGWMASGIVPATTGENGGRQ